MNVKEKVLNALRDRDNAIKSRKQADSLLELASREEVKMEAELIRVIQANFPNRGVIYQGNRYTVKANQGEVPSLVVEKCEAEVLG